jgi:hypothetical protein
MIRFLKNIGEYFSANYFDEDFAKKVIDKSGYKISNDDSTDDDIATENTIKQFQKKLSPLSEKYFKFKRTITEGKLPNKYKIEETHHFNTFLLNLLGYDAKHTQYNDLYMLNDKEAIPVRHILRRGTQTHLMILEMQALIADGDAQPDGLFEQSYNIEEQNINAAAQKYHKQQWDLVFKVPDDVKISPNVVHTAISELFLQEPHHRPKYILLMAGNCVFLAEAEKWFRGSYLQIDIEELCVEAIAQKSANYYALLYLLLSKETLAPDSNMVLLDQLDEDSHKSAYEVTKDLKEGIINAVEALANEALYYLEEICKQDVDETNDTFEQEVKDDCLRIVYRLLFIFYAESRTDLDILPSNDSTYTKGYSLEMLRDLEQVPLATASSMNGYFFDDSIQKLFTILSTGYGEQLAQNKSFRVRKIDSPFFDKQKMNHLHQVRFRNSIWQNIICQLSLSKEQAKRNRGRISYANLGINQLGSVYESLLAYRGFYAEQDYIEVHKANKPQDGTYLVPRIRRDDFEENEILKDNKHKDVILPKGKFVYRLSGRDRQKSASYYTPEVLTQCTVKYTLKPVIEQLDAGTLQATDLLELKLLEPAMGAAAFHNEMINQLAETYLQYAQTAKKNKGCKTWRIEPDKYKYELQKVKAYIATNNVYGVDINPTAIELGKLSLWLNVIHKDMETPFFSNRICVGNAVVGAWLKVYDSKAIKFEFVKDSKTKTQPKEWWTTAPRLLTFNTANKTNTLKTDRKATEYYHFLLPDKGMLASANIKLLKQDATSKKIAEIKKNWLAPIGKTEEALLQKICTTIDALLAEYYVFQKTIISKTASRQHIFGANKAADQRVLNLQSYDEKEKLADQRNRHNAPYYKLKLVMDYWCALWFWDARQATHLPTRQQYYADVCTILELDVQQALEGVLKDAKQIDVFGKVPDGQYQLNLQSATTETVITDNADDFAKIMQAYVDKPNMFDKNERIAIVHLLAKRNRFFHPQLEFLEVFWERGGFDLIAGNPPWVNILLDEGGIISESNPEVVIRDLSSPEISSQSIGLLRQNTNLEASYILEAIWAESSKAFIGSFQNYSLLDGQRNNLYKCILLNSLSILNKNGYCGLVHPEGVYEDPKARILRVELYKRLIYHFQFKNEILLFQDVMNTRMFSVNIYGAKKDEIKFLNISNIFHPITVELCLTANTTNGCLGLKKFNVNKGKYDWNLDGNTNRVITFDNSLLKLISGIYDNEKHLENSVLLPKLHSSFLLEILQVFYNSNLTIGDLELYITDCWNEVNAVNSNFIIKESFKPDIKQDNIIISSPHIFVNNPFYKNPYLVCSSPKHYECIDLSISGDDFFQRTNFMLVSNALETYFNNVTQQKWLKSYKIAISKMIDPGTERTLQASIIAPYTTHTNGIISISFQDDSELITSCGSFSSLIFDFYIKSTGRTNLYEKTLRSIPFLNYSSKYKKAIILRTLRLNCLSAEYSTLWQNNFLDDFRLDRWSTNDIRMDQNFNLCAKWNRCSALRNYYERRICQIEIDVIVAQFIGLKLEGLINLYETQFPTLLQNEEDTWYDAKGSIVFTVNSQGLKGVGVDRPVWETIRHLQAGETYTHTITKSELYQGQQVVYHAPFGKCDRVEDYKVAWEWFEGVFE